MDMFDDTALALMKFGVGQPVPRMEDPTLLRGKGSYTDDAEPAGPGLCGHGPQQACARHPERASTARRRGDARRARRSWTYADMEAAGFGPMKCGVNFPQRDGRR